MVECVVPIVRLRDRAASEFADESAIIERD
jgi:hypothetical protein